MSKVVSYPLPTAPFHLKVGNCKLLIKKWIEMERKKNVIEQSKGFIERRILIGLIVSTEYLRQIHAVWDYQYIESPTAKKIARWCWEYFEKYNKAPFKDIEAIYFTKLKEDKLNSTLAEEIEKDILPGLSDEYEKGSFNLNYLLDQTLKYFKQRQLKIHSLTIQSLLAENNLEEAEKLTKSFKPLEIVSPTNKIDNYIYSIDELRKLDIEEPLMLMSPWLRTGQFTFIYGDVGAGKSLLALHIAYVLGLEKSDREKVDIGDWFVQNPTGCLYIDGELGAVDLEERISGFEWLGKQNKEMILLSFPLPEYQLSSEDEFMLSERENQKVVIQWLKLYPEYKLLILDSVTTLFGLTEENSNSEWSTKINPFLRDLRALGVACILLHHAGKDTSRGLRGSSAMGAMAHNIFKLTDHPDKDIDEGEAWFTITKDKQRSAGFQFKKFSMHYSQDSSFTKTEWEITDNGQTKTNILSTLQIRIIRHLIRGNMKQTEIAERVNCKPPYIVQVKKRAHRLGYLKEDQSPTALWDDLYGEFINKGQDEDK